MTRQARKPRLLKELEKNNPGVVVIEKGRSHWKILVNGEFTGIYPLTPHKEGLAENTKSALRRKGVKLA